MGGGARGRSQGCVGEECVGEEPGGGAREVWGGVCGGRSQGCGGGARDVWGEEPGMCGGRSRREEPGECGGGVCGGRSQGSVGEECVGGGARGRSQGCVGGARDVLGQSQGIGEYMYLQ